jgi:hypothetical protein
MQAILSTRVMDFTRLLRQAGPYVVLEVILPGGTLFALLLYLHRTGQLRRLAGVFGFAGIVLRAAGRAFDQFAFVLQPLGAPAGAARDGLEPLSFISNGR